MKPPRLFLIGTGVGRDLRGFEAHILDLFMHVNAETGYETYLIKAAGALTNREIPISNIYRKSRLARVLGFLTGKNPYVIQNLSFFIGFIPTLYRFKPTALYLGEPVLFNYLYRWRNFTKMRFRMIFFTGGNTVPLKMKPEDFLQLVTPVLFPLATRRGVLARQMKVIPHFINPTIASGSLTTTARLELRERLGIPTDPLVILSVGAIDFSVKRMDYLIDEVSHLSVPYYLIMLGEYELETSTIREMAEKKLGVNNFRIDRVPRKDLTPYYRGSDMFVLASLQEGFGLVTLEAMLHGLPVLVHRHAAAEFVLGKMASYSDFSKEKNLTHLIENTIPHIRQTDNMEMRRKYVVDRFSWTTLSEDYRQMLTTATEDSSN